VAAVAADTTAAAVAAADTAEIATNRTVILGKWESLTAFPFLFHPEEYLPFTCFSQIQFSLIRLIIQNFHVILRAI
jgi:hypothetical protein